MNTVVERLTALASASTYLSLDAIAADYERVYKEGIPVFPPRYPTVAAVVKQALPDFTMESDRSNPAEPSQGSSTTAKENQRPDGNSSSSWRLATKEFEASSKLYNEQKRTLRPLSGLLKCGLCRAVVREPIMISTCQHLFCWECVAQSRKGSDDSWVSANGNKSVATQQNQIRVSCPSCNSNTAVYALRPDSTTSRGKLSGLILWLISHEFPFQCAACGFVDTIENHISGHKTCAIDKRRHSSSCPTAPQLRAVVHLARLTSHLMKLYMSDQKGVLHTRVCAYLVVVKDFDPDVHISDKAYADRFMRVKAFQTVELLAHPQNQIYGYSCVKFRHCAIHKWLPTACLIPETYSKQQFVSILDELNWQDTAKFSAEPVPLISGPL